MYIFIYVYIYIYIYRTAAGWLLPLACLLATVRCSLAISASRLRSSPVTSLAAHIVLYHITYHDIIV